LPQTLFLKTFLLLKRFIIEVFVNKETKEFLLKKNLYFSFWDRFLPKAKSIFNALEACLEEANV